MDRPQWKENKSWRKKEYSSCLISCATLVVWQWAISNGWRTWNMWDLDEWTENGKRRRSKTWWMLFNGQPICQLSDSNRCNFYKAPDKSTSYTPVCRRLCLTLLRRWSPQQCRRSWTCERQPLWTLSTVCMSIIRWLEWAIDFELLSLFIIE